MEKIIEKINNSIDELEEINNEYHEYFIGLKNEKTINEIKELIKELYI